MVPGELQTFSERHALPVHQPNVRVSEVLDADAHAWFLEHGGLTRVNGQRFRNLWMISSAVYRCFAMARALR